MKPEEAIEILELPKDPLQSGTHYHAIPSLKRITYSEYLDARATAIAALEKQVAKKVTFRNEYLCGNCNVTINSEDCYCYNCGQRQDWSVEED